MGAQFGGGNTNGLSSGESQGLTGGTTNATGTQNSTQTGSQSGQSTVDPTALYGSLSGLLGSNIGSSGLNSTQQSATDDLQNYLTQNSNNGLWQQLNSNQQLMPYTNTQANTIAPTSGVSAPTAASGMAAYQNPYTQQVVNATTNDAMQSFQNQLNDINAQYGGEMGNGRAGVASGQAAGDATRALATSIGGLQSQGFNTALQGGENDAANQLSASQANAANTLQSSEFNSGQQDVANQTSMAAIQNMINNSGSIMNQGTSSLQQLYNMGGGGLQNILAGMQSQVPAFNQSTSGTTTGSSTDNSTQDQTAIGSSSDSYSGANRGSNSNSGMKI